MRNENYQLRDDDKDARAARAIGIDDRRRGGTCGTGSRTIARAGDGTTYSCAQMKISFRYASAHEVSFVELQQSHEVVIKNSVTGDTVEEGKDSTIGGYWWKLADH